MSIDTFNSNKVNAEWKALLPSPSPKCGSTQKQYYPSAALNPTKNRYPDVLAYEQTLVPLSTGQYINANFTQTSPCTTFISTQGPLPQTFDDFWQMVWDHHVPVVVMLTRLLERRRVKAHCYWPSEIGETEIFNTLSVRLDSVFEDPDQIVIRVFTISNDEESRSVAHIHYTEWPDFGVPRCTSGIRRVIELMEEYRTKYGCKTQPCIIHCSAGIGRTGTLLAIHAFLEKVSEGVPPSQISIPEIVNNLRSQRMCMVQTKEQYRFIYKVVDEVLVRKGNPCSLNSIEPPSDVSDYVQGSECFRSVRVTPQGRKALTQTSTLITPPQNLNFLVY